MLTDIKIRNAKPKDKAYKITDEKGLYLLVQVSGGKLWRYDYRYFGKRKTLALGIYPDVGLNKAREFRDDARKLLASDVDPGEVRKATKLSKFSMDFPDFSRHLIMSKMKRRGLYATHQIYGRI